MERTILHPVPWIPLYRKFYCLSDRKHSRTKQNGLIIHTIGSYWQFPHADNMKVQVKGTGTRVLIERGSFKGISTVYEYTIHLILCQRCHFFWTNPNLMGKIACLCPLWISKLCLSYCSCVMANGFPERWERIRRLYFNQISRTTSTCLSVSCV